MNDRAVSVLENYECKVLRSYKGRSAIICETDSGLKILKEYRGLEQRIREGDMLLRQMQSRSDYLLERYVPTKEGNFITKDREQNTYILKDYFEGKECQVTEQEDLVKAFSHMAKLHREMYFEEGADTLPSEEYSDLPIQKEKGVCRFLQETEKRNRELRRVKSYLRKKGQRSEFENYLLLEYDRFLKKALEVEKELGEAELVRYYDEIAEKRMFCHGDYQYHNVLFVGDRVAVINFEKFQYDSVVKDFALFFRKVMEKNNWDEELGKRLLDAYMENRPMEKLELRQLFLRLSYPEKFWKIVNFYINNKKTVTSNRNMGKLTKLITQEEELKKCISFLETIVYN